MSANLSEESWKKIDRLGELVEEMAIELDKLRQEREAGAKKIVLPTDFLKVADFLLAKKNRPRSAWAIMKATGITRSSLSQILHRTHKGMFVGHEVPGYSRKKFWSLTDEAAKEAKSLIEHETRRSQMTTLFELEEGEFTGRKAVDSSRLF